MYVEASEKPIWGMSKDMFEAYEREARMET